MSGLAVPMPESAPPAPPALRGRIVALLAIAMFLNYADRGSLSIVAPLLRDRLAISDWEMGILLGGFFWTYSFAQPFAGWLSQRVDVRLALAGGVALWSGATMLSGLADSFLMLLALRLLLGLGESVIFPANACLLAARVPEHARGNANAWVTMGMALGPSVGTLAGGLILAGFGWRAVFFVLGAVSLLWLVPWFATPIDAPDCARAEAEPPPPYREILRQRSLWAASVGQFCYSFQPYLLLTWLPLFLVKQQHYSLAQMAWIGAAIYAGQACAAYACGALSDRMIRAGVAGSRVRRSFILVGVGGGMVAMLAASLSSGVFVLCSLAVAAVFTGITSPMVFTIGQTLSGPRAGGRWMGIQNMVGNFSGIAAPMLAGAVLQRSGSLSGAFVAAAGLAVLGFFCWGVAIERIEPTRWRSVA